MVFVFKEVLIGVLFGMVFGVLFWVIENVGYLIDF